MGNKSKKPLSPFDAWSKRIDDLAKGAPSDDRFDYELDEIISQLERGDYSSLDPELRKEIEERERREKNKKVAKPKRKEATI